MKKPHKENVIGWVLLVLAIGAVAGFSYAITLIVAPIKVRVHEDSFTIQCLYHEETIAFADVQSLTLSVDYKSSTKRGQGGQAKEFGVYKNESFGSHYRLTYTENTRNYIVCVKKDGSVTVFNQRTEEKTKTMYERLSEKIA